MQHGLMIFKLNICINRRKRVEKITIRKYSSVSLHDLYLLGYCIVLYVVCVYLIM